MAVGIPRSASVWDENTTPLVVFEDCVFRDNRAPPPPPGPAPPYPAYAGLPADAPPV